MPSQPRQLYQGKWTPRCVNDVSGDTWTNQYFFKGTDNLSLIQRQGL